MVICWELVICRSQPLPPKNFTAISYALHKKDRYIGYLPIWVSMSRFYADINKLCLIKRNR